MDGRPLGVIVNRFQAIECPYIVGFLVMASDDLWNGLLRDFCYHGGIAENISNKEGRYGRGIFPKDATCNSRIFTPKNLLVNVDCLRIKGGSLSINDDSALSSEQRDFVERYYNLFSWGDQGNSASIDFLKEVALIPDATKKILLDSGFISNDQLGLNADCQEHILQRFIAERCVTFQGEVVLAPVWELVNHSAFSPSLRITRKGVETPPRPLSDSEILFKYSAKSSPIGMWKNYGFACRSIFAYSIPVRIDVDSPAFVVQCDGGLQGLNVQRGRNVKFEDELVTISSLVVGCMSRDLPLSELSSILKKLSFSGAAILTLLREIQSINLNVRRSLLSSLEAAGLDGKSALHNALKLEVELIQNSM